MKRIDTDQYERGYKMSDINLKVEICRFCTQFLTLNTRLASLKARLARTPETDSVLRFCKIFSIHNHLQSLFSLDTHIIT
jgi:hypothetical protein